MNKTLCRNGGLVLLFLVFYRNILVWVVEYFFRLENFEFALLFLVIIFLIGLKIFLEKKNLKKIFIARWSWVCFVGLVGSMCFDLLNTAFWHYHIVSALTFFLGLYFLLGFYLRDDLWRRSSFLFGVLALTLPFIDHIQVFLGFPIRMMTAKIVSVIMGMMGYQSVTEAGVIFTENNASFVDLPCSGVKSIYTGAIFALVVFFLSKVKLSWKLLGITIGYFGLLVLFNIWRVFTLVFVYDVMVLEEAGDFIHVGLGVIGFLVSGVLLIWAVKKWCGVSADKKALKKLKKEKPNMSEGRYWLLYFVLICFLFADFLVMKVLDSFDGVIEVQKKNVELSVKDVSLEEIAFTNKEVSFFENSAIQYSKKFEGMIEGFRFSLLVVTSDSWQRHHNPEVCLKGVGYEIEESQIAMVGGDALRNVILGRDEGEVLYWFTNGEEILADYSERAWRGLRNPDEAWTMIEIGVSGELDLQDERLVELVENINAAVSVTLQ